MDAIHTKSFTQTIDKHLSEFTASGLIGLAVAYAALVVIVRWQMIASPIHHQLNARLDILKSDAHRLDYVGGSDQHGTVVDIQREVQEIVALASAKNQRRTLADVLFWSRGKETAIWLLIDKAESLMVTTWPVGKLETRLFTMQSTLKHLGSQIATELSHRIQYALNRPAKAYDHSTRTQDEFRELYREAMRVQREALHSDDVEADYFNNKILWYILMSLMAISFVANIGPGVSATLFVLTDGVPGIRRMFVMYLVAGAVGGILSRLARALGTGPSRGSASARAGSSWMDMFLSPLVGALTGWAGTLLLRALHELGILAGHVTGPKFELLTICAAVLFGFSERLFTELAGKLEDNLMSKRSPATPPAEHAADP